MAFDTADRSIILDDLVKQQLKPFVKKIDAEAYYARDYLLSLGKSGFLSSEQLSDIEIRLNGVTLVEETAKSCMTTAFNLWCHLAALTYLRTSDNMYLRETVLPQLENGERLGATGLSNPMKYFAGLEKLHLKAERVDGGYSVTGQLGAVSNLGPDHWFGVVAQAEGDQRVIALVSCEVEGLELKEKVGYLGLNGSATYSCKFSEVFIPDEWVIAEHADSFVQQIRPNFVVYQIPLGLGIISESIQGIEQARNRQCGCNSYLKIQKDDLETEYEELRERFYRLIGNSDLNSQLELLLRTRLDTAYLTLKAVHACMLHQGGAAYIQNSDASRRLREAYFLANLTPTIKHLEKVLCG
jgi:alkylation response protein AidB-like acyl-CoA dehydrogenase